MAPSPSRPAGGAGAAQAAAAREEHRNVLNASVTKLVNKQATNGGLMTPERYRYIVSHLHEYPNLANKDKQYSIAQLYRIQAMGESEWLVPAKASPGSLEELQRHVHTGELFEVLLTGHQATGHGQHTSTSQRVCILFGFAPTEFLISGIGT